MIGTRRQRADDLSAAAACYDRDAAVLYHFLVASGDERGAAERMAAVFAAHFRADLASCPSRVELLRTAQLVTSDVCDRRAAGEQTSLVARAESLALVARLDVAGIAYVLDVSRHDVCRLLDGALRRRTATSANV